VTLVLPNLLYFPLLMSGGRDVVTALFALYTSPYIPAALALIPCLVALAFALLERFKPVAGVAPAP
jgi:hypothetical protein